MYIVGDLLATDGKVSIPATNEGRHIVFDTLDAAADHLVWLEKKWLSCVTQSNYKIYRVQSQIADYPIAQARKRAKFAESAEDEPVPPSVYDKIAALILSELRDLEGEEPVSRAVYEDLVTQNQNLTAKVAVFASDNTDLERSRDQWKDMHRDKCLELADEFKRIDKIRKALDEE